MGKGDESSKRNKKKDKAIITRQKIGPYSTRSARIKEGQIQNPSRTVQSSQNS